MQRLSPAPRPPARTESAVVDALGPLLAARGLALRPGPGEDAEAHARALESGLLCLFRDERCTEAFELLYERTRGWLFRWVLHVMGGRGPTRDPLELLQDTFVNIYRYASSFKEEQAGGFRPWARTIAANVVRRARSRGLGRPLCALPEGAQEPVDPRPSPDAEASIGEQQVALRRAWQLVLLHYAAAFGRLSPRDREALTLVEVEGRSYDDAGRLLRVGRSNMKMIMFRSRKRIRGHMLAAMGSADTDGGLAASRPTVRAAG